jgi:hypothetical protein
VSAVPDNEPYPWEKIETRQARTEAESGLRSRFRNWLTDLDDDQLAALAHNWENVLDDAALDRVDSWVIAGKAITDLRSRPPAASGNPVHTCGEAGYTSREICSACQAGKPS